VPTSIPAVVAFTTILFTALCTVMIILMATCLGISARRNSSHSHTQINTVPGDHEIFQKRFVVIVLSSVLCWWPVFVLHVLYAFGTRESSSDLAIVNLVGMAIPSALHPVIYVSPGKVKMLRSCRCYVTGYIQNYESIPDEQIQFGHCCCFTCTQDQQIVVVAQS
jgi:hypothetical protein